TRRNWVKDCRLQSGDADEEVVVKTAEEEVDKPWSGQESGSVRLRSARSSCEGDGWTGRIKGVKKRVMGVKREPREPGSFHMKCQLFHPDRAEKDSPSLSRLYLSSPLTFSLSFISLTLFLFTQPSQKVPGEHNYGWRLKFAI
ncbi:hypothetical protein PO909_001404, partial [Leuciscus waleckii]